MQDRKKKKHFVFSIQLIDAWKLNMTYLLEAKILHCPADLPLCLLSFPYYKLNVRGTSIFNNLLLCRCSTESLQMFQFFSFPAQDKAIIFLWKLGYKGSRNICTYQNHLVRTEAMPKSFSSTQVYEAFMGASLGKGRTLTPGRDWFSTTQLQSISG